MSKWSKFRTRLLSGLADQNIAFEDLRGFLTNQGFSQRSVGGHHIFSKDGVEEIINLQPRRDGTSKPYQVRQVREIVLKYKLEDNDA